MMGSELVGHLAQLGGLGGLAAAITSIAALRKTLQVKSDTEQLRPNHGSSVADGIGRIERELGTLQDQVREESRQRVMETTRIRDDLTTIRQDMHTERLERLRLQDSLG